MGSLGRVILGIVVVILVSSAALIGACADSPPSPTAPGPDTSPTLQATPGGDDYVEVVYFHRTRRCYSCQYAGDMTQQTVETYFADELASGMLVFRTLDVQEKANAEIVKKYGASGSSLYINMVTDGVDHIEHIVGIWYKIGNEQAFIDVLRPEIAQALGSI